MTASAPARKTRRVRAVIALLIALAAAVGPVVAADATPTARISGNGSSWAGNALADWQAAIKAQGVTVDFTPDGSSSGRKNFAQGLSDFAVSEIPYKGDTSDPQDSQYPGFGFAMLPVVAGGTSFMYNLPVNGQKSRSLQLSQAAIAKIFSGQVTQWNDPVIAATNPGVNLPAQRITVVVRSDGSGATAQFTLWMLRQFPQDYAALCAKTGCNPQAATSYFPYQGLSNFTAQSQSQGVTTYTANTPYTINYDEYSYALGVNFPVAKVQNASGFYTVPTDSAVAVALTQAKINSDTTSPNYLSQDLSAVYPYKDPRTYPISAYSYLIVPTEAKGNFSTGKGATLGYFSAFSLCEGQRTMGALGYSPLPMNLVLAAMDQVLKIPGVDADTQKTISNTKAGVASGTSNPCNNPTFKPGDDPAHNILIDKAPFPEGCDATCQAPWHTVAAGTTTGTKTTTKTPTKTTTKTGSSTTGGTTTATDPGTQTPTADGSTPVVDSGAPAACDADTGVCGTGDTTQTTSDAIAPVASPLVIDGKDTWGSSQLALALCVLFVALLIFLPPVAARVLAVRRHAPASLPQQRAGGSSGQALVDSAGSPSSGPGSGGAA